MLLIRYVVSDIDGTITDAQKRIQAVGIRCLREVQEAGVVDGFQRLPDTAAVPGLADLSTRQWDIVTRLLRGERVPDIARANFVSQSTVRNQLGVIFQKLGVHSQAQLLSLLRGDKGQSV